MATFGTIPPLFSPPPLHQPIESLQAQKPFILFFNHRICFKCSKLRASRIRHHSCARPRPRFVPLAVDGGEATGAEEPEATQITERTLDIKLPRRSLLVHFTCGACGERTQRTINRLAYERGTVFVQCAGCLQHHKLVDNLGLVVEYDLREERSSSTGSV